ncbi:MAG: M23 family metallopeptidase [Lachnospiraceae bacterium]|nr:M23 family metallopeptidase [Lachnospiraceae bacterium]
MNKIADFFRSKGFYIALGVGIFTLISLIVAYSYRSNKKELTGKQAIDLNQPILSDADEDIKDDTDNKETVVTNAEPKKEVAGETDAAKPADVVTEKKDEKKEQAKDETDNNTLANNDKDVADVDEVVGVTSDGTIVADEVTLNAGFSYDGEQTLAWPVIGNVILPFSMETTVYYQTLDAYRCNRGMLIEGEEGENVLSAYEGVVTAVEDTKEFGTVVKIDMGNGYEATYGQLMNVCVSVGDTVSLGQNIAEIGPVSSYYTKEGTHLYFEITKDGVPVNPMTLIR